ncbi:hypothetical protein O181_023281 [Austropuccinia psidii MF-1]|uniref:Uncharacterized protein n=1 Tax=Austropuccinia psidii MF-1 TaxID=1389203 RepID=A0A9Q3GXH7_9BASI|nr:hypothetical protein [Austropuccinia psidii MF-1]
MSPEEDKDRRARNRLLSARGKIVRPNDTEGVGTSEGSTQNQKIIVNTSDRISKPTIRNDIPTHNEHSVVTPDSNINSDELWLKMSQFSEKTQQKLEKLHEIKLSLEELLNLQNTTIQTL